jgi:hypothetical protein
VQRPNAAARSGLPGLKRTESEERKEVGHTVQQIDQVTQQNAALV